MTNRRIPPPPRRRPARPSTASVIATGVVALVATLVLYGAAIVAFIGLVVLALNLFGVL